MEFGPLEGRPQAPILAHPLTGSNFPVSRAGEGPVPRGAWVMGNSCLCPQVASDSGWHHGLPILPAVPLHLGAPEWGCPWHPGLPPV